MLRTPSKAISVLRSFPVAVNEAAQYVAECDDGEKLAAAQEESEYHKEYTASKEKLDELLLERFQVEAERAELKLSRTEEDRVGFGEHWDKRAWGRLEGLKDEANKAIVRYLEAKLEHLEGQRELALLAKAKVEEGQAKCRVKKVSCP